MVPKDTEIVIPIYFMGRNPRIFTDPETFWPERFLLENGISDSSPFSYVPFSAGMRNCKKNEQKVIAPSTNVRFNF